MFSCCFSFFRSTCIINFQLIVLQPISHVSLAKLVERIKYKKSKREDLLKNGRDFRSKFDRFARGFEVKITISCYCQVFLFIIWESYQWITTVSVIQDLIITTQRIWDSGAYGDCMMTGKYGNCTIMNENGDEVYADAEQTP